METNSKNGSRLSPWSVTALIVLFVLVAPFALLWLSQCDFIYYRHYNRIKALVEKLPDAKITDTWLHRDITLEDFGFDVQVRQCEPIRLNFYEGGDWYRDFGTTDGIIFSKPYNPATNDYEITMVSCDELARAGIRVRNLADTISQLEAVLAYLKSRPDNQSDTPRGGAYYIRIYYDLNAYKQTQSATSR